MKFYYRFLYCCFFLTIIIILYYYFLDFSNNIIFTKKNDFVNANEIAIVIIIDNETITNYEQAVKTVHCYSIHYNYTFIIINDNKNSSFGTNCLQKDFMFRRHCIISDYGLKFEDIIKYIVFIDGDIGVVNPLHRIEEYLPKNKEEILFYDRIFNKEIAAGSYIIKNNLYTRNLLMSFANYDFKIPIFNDGSDNVALQVFILDFLGTTNNSSEYNQCMKLYNTSIGYDQNMIVVSCFKWILNKLDETPYNNDYYTFDKGRIKIVRKLSSKRWVRDTWLANWKYCDKDFLHHGWKTKEIIENDDKFKNEFNSSDALCKSSDFLHAWNYISLLKVTCKEIDKEINYWIYNADAEDIKNIYLSNVTKLLIID
uniref:Glyco_trans_2-like domain-containing protein n=1 Tax=Strongyloides stercoralis TaxID=6248 RepID=A0A0K0EC05_STRER